ncbi:MAG: branched-chain amino acid ABC transporter permease, partial [Chloroflexi bacterium]
LSGDGRLRPHSRARGRGPRRSRLDRGSDPRRVDRRTWVCDRHILVPAVRDRPDLRGHGRRAGAAPFGAARPPIVILGRLASARNAALLAVLGLGLASVPLWAPRFWIYVATQALIFAVFAMSLDLLLGYAGLPSLGHAAFYGVGAYACALLALRQVDGLFPLLLVGGAAAAIVAIPIGALSLRTSGVYFLMLTLAFAQMLWGLAVNWVSLTRGTDGLIGIPRPTLVGLDALEISLYERGAFFVLCLVVAVLTFAVLQILARSPFGKTLEGIRENETRMRALGVPTFRYRLAAFVVAAAI